MVQEERKDISQVDKEIKELEKQLKLKEQKEKKGSSKFKIKLSRSQLKDNYVYCFFIKNNGALVIKKLKIIDGTVYVKELNRYYMANPKYIMKSEKNLPVMIIEEWSIEPLNPKEIFEEDDDTKKIADYENFLIKVVELAQAKLKDGMGNMKWLWIILAGIIVIYIIFKALAPGAAP